MITQILAFIFRITPEVAHAAATCNTAAGEKPGVLVDCTNPNDTFFQYLSKVLTQNNGYVIAIAVIIVVFSGVQYMLAFGNTSNQGKAKERIISVVIGIIFYTLIRFFLVILADGLSVP